MRRTIVELMISIMLIIITVGGSLLHIYTVYLCAIEGGFLSALFTFCMPVIGEIFYFFQNLFENGLFHSYSVITIGYLFIILICFLSSYSLEK